MPPIPHKLLERLHKEVAELATWLASTQPQDDGSAQREDLVSLYEKSQSIYRKSQALHETTVEDPNEFEQLRHDVSKFDYWLSSEVDPTNPEHLQAFFTRANAISLRALSLFRTASQSSHDQQEAGDEPATLSSE